MSVTRELIDLDRVTRVHDPNDPVPCEVQTAQVQTCKQLHHNQEIGFQKSAHLIELWPQGLSKRPMVEDGLHSHSPLRLMPNPLLPKQARPIPSMHEYVNSVDHGKTEMTS